MFNVPSTRPYNIASSIMNYLLRTIFFIGSFTWLSCNQNPHKPETESILTGTTTILADESVFPIVDDQHIVFSYLYPRAHVNIVYGAEKKLLAPFFNAKHQVAILARALTEKEKKYYQQRNIRIRIDEFATDALALIVHRNNATSRITLSQFKQYLLGRLTAPFPIVLDNPNSSITNYLFNLIGQPHFGTSNIYALQNNRQVVEYVAKHSNALGVVSLNWLTQPPKNLIPYLSNVKLVALQAKPHALYYKPSQTSIANRDYALTRKLYIYNAQGKSGLGLGFAAFLASDRGQRMVLKSGLLPATIPPRAIHVRK